MNRLRMLLMTTALIAGSSALASAEDHDRDRGRDHHNGYVYRNGGGYNNGYYNGGRYNDHDRDDRWRNNDHDRDDRWRGDRDNRWRRDDDDRRGRGWWNRGRDRD